jgi:hypothetical protein
VVAGVTVALGAGSFASSAVIFGVPLAILLVAVAGCVERKQARAIRQYGAQLGSDKVGPIRPGQEPLVSE